MEYVEYLKNNNVLLSSVINLIDDLIFYKDKDFKYLGCNTAFLNFINKSPEDMLGKDDFEIFDHDLATTFRHNDKLMLAKGHVRTNEEWVTYPDGRKVYLLTKKIPFEYDGCNIGILGISRDITSLEKANQQLKDQALLDELTSIKNRKAYNLKIKSLLAGFERYNIPFSIISIDIDDFKNINDNYGHDVGDKVLQRFSELIEKHIRQTDHLFRIGGEEFVILSESRTQADVVILAEKLRETVAKITLLSDINITISLGICEVIKGDDANSIAKRVDTLLYQAKSHGKNTVTYQT
ncbi:GGDEF domain-containing protein [Colwellia psychrerythraea]|uniref:diguanylate cyclase n=1 Tax=Colwellia psychrerythraea TaxID=28229 RepID=A0A099KRK9_COLPS|nr:GGDEF domain-containing protein [Colwellia psychrerythraea]KGJ92293.1 diguanylate cyclase with PAS/PAC sensor [Colwellia psychrerythraea]